MAKKPLSEKQSREQLIGWARKYGCEADLLKIFVRYDDYLKGCRNESERKAIAAMGVKEIDSFFTAKSTHDMLLDGKLIK